MAYDVWMHGEAITVQKIQLHSEYWYLQYSLVMDARKIEHRIESPMAVVSYSGSGAAVNWDRNPDHSLTHSYWSLDFILRVREGEIDLDSGELDRSSPLVKEYLLNYIGDRTILPKPGHCFRMVFKAGKIVDIVEVPAEDGLRDRMISCKTGQEVSVKESLKERCNRECVEDEWMIRKEDGTHEVTPLGERAFEAIHRYYFGDKDGDED